LSKLILAKATASELTPKSSIPNVIMSMFGHLRSPWG
jgi:hypothetical protein